MLSSVKSWARVTRISHLNKGKETGANVPLPSLLIHESVCSSLELGFLLYNLKLT